MPKKLFVSIALVLLIVPIYFQIARAADEEMPITGPLTPPITSPETPTPTETEPTPTTTVPSPTVSPTDIPTVTPTASPSVTPTPTEEPEEDGTIHGKVIYRRIGPFRGGPRASDAAGVDVTVKNFFGGSEVGSDTTDTHGMYSIDVPPGFYKVILDDEDSTFFVPPLRIINLHDDQTKQANFQGLVF